MARKVRGISGVDRSARPDRRVGAGRRRLRPECSPRRRAWRLAVVVVGLLAFGAAARATLGRPFYWASGLILGLALLSAISSLWSGSIELSVTEADRVLVYLGFFLAAFLIAQTDQRRQRFAEGIAIALALVAFLALASRLLPHVLELGPGLGSGPRLRYPLGYWNANGVVFGIGVALLLWMSRRSLNASLRWLAVGVAAGGAAGALLHLLARRPAGAARRLRLPAGALPRPALAARRRWRSGPSGRCPRCSPCRRAAASPTTSTARRRSTRAPTVLLFLVAGIALALAAVRRPATARGQRTAA